MFEIDPPKLELLQDSIFKHHTWNNVIKKQYDYKLVSFSTPENLDQSFDSISFFIVKSILGSTSLVALPFSDYFPVFQNDQVDALLEKVLEYFDQNNINSIEIRDNITTKNFQQKQVGYIHYLKLTNNIEKIFNNFKKTQVQQPIRKAIRDGLTTKIRTNYKSVLEFYKLHLKTRKKLGVPIQPKKFFYHFWHEIINSKLGFVVLVYLDKKVVSSGIFAGYQDVLTYKFSASDPEYLRFRPNNLMLWTAIQEAQKRGFKIFDFGRTDLDTEGLRKFKLGWGTVELPLYYSYYPKAPDTSKLNYIKNKIVAPIIRHAPTFVCRWMGELFYKYFG